MFTFLITYGADSEMAMFEAESPAHAVEQFCNWAPVSPEHDENFLAINSVAVCIPVEPHEDGVAYAHSTDGSYFGLGGLDVTFVPEHVEDVEEYLFG